MARGLKRSLRFTRVRKTSNAASGNGWRARSRPRAERLHVLMLVDLERVDRIGSCQETMLGHQSKEVG
jgi:hypothetical protein